MKGFRTAGVLAALAVAFVAAPASGQSASQDLTYEVQAFSVISLAAGAPSLVISDNTYAASASSTYDVETTEANKTITAAISAPLATGVNLTIDLAAPAGATAQTATFDNSDAGVAQTVVSGISTLQETGLAVDYGLSASPSAGVVAATTLTVTYTIQ